MDEGLIGRDREVVSVLQLLRRDDVSLVTLSGPGGIGKTRLAFEVARRASALFEHGSATVMLAAVRDPEFVVASIVEALGLGGSAGVPALERMRSFLLERRLLLVLDNFEQVVQAAPIVAELVAHAPGLKVLVTSRTRLHVGKEHEFTLGALELPRSPFDGAASAAGAPAVALFVRRAQAVCPDFVLARDNAEAVVAICLRLEGWPLAIELAAARIRILPPDELLKRLQKRLPLLTGGPVDQPLRQRTVRATLDWSHELLCDDERALLARLSVFKGGATLEAVEAVCMSTALDRLGGLLDQSLVTQAGGRFCMLEIVREFAEEKLEERGEADVLRLRHAEHFADLAARAEAGLAGSEQRAWLDGVDAEIDNLREAIGWALRAGRPELALRVSASLGTFWIFRARAAEGRRWLEAALAAAQDTRDTLRAKALGWCGACCLRSGDVPQAVIFGEDALARYRELGEPAGTARVLTDVGWALSWGGSGPEAARGAFEESEKISRDNGDLAAQARATVALGTWHAIANDLTAARTHLERGLALSRRAGDLLRMGTALNNLASVAIDEGRRDEGRRLIEEALALQRAFGDRASVLGGLFNLSNLEQAAGDFARAYALLKEGMVGAYDIADLRQFLFGIPNVAQLFLEAGRPGVCARLLAAAQALHARQGIAHPERYAENGRKWADRAQALLGTEAFETASREGSALGLSQVRAMLDVLAIEDAAAGAPAAATRDEAAASGLTARERDVLALVAQGLSDRGIAERLRISPATASKHVANVLSKTGQRNRLALALWAAQQGIVPRTSR